MLPLLAVQTLKLRFKDIQLWHRHREYSIFNDLLWNIRSN